MRDHADICSELFSKAEKHGYIAAMRSPRYRALIDRFQINTIERAAMFLASGAHETGGFTILRENGNYTSATRIVEIFGVGRHSAAITEAEAKRLVRNPYALFERVYGLGNPTKAAELGNVREGDGFLFRGCGFDQLTGRRDQERYASAIGCTVDQLSLPINSIHGALLEWERKNCNALADRGDLKAVRRAINGGLNGWEDYKAKYALIRKALADDNSGPIALGSRGDEVRQLQEQLQARGFYKGNKIDGLFGALTDRSLSAFQKAQELPVTGVFDRATQQGLLSAPIEPTLPGRKISVVQSIQDMGHKIITSILTALGLTEGANQLGFEPIENLLSAVDKVRGLLAKFQVQPRFMVYAAIALGIYMLIKFVRTENAD